MRGRTLVLRLVGAQATDLGQGTLDGAEDVADRDVVRVAQEGVATLGAALARDEPAEAQVA